jgi:hypothetical protein
VIAEAGVPVRTTRQPVKQNVSGESVAGSRRAGATESVAGNTQAEQPGDPVSRLKLLKVLLAEGTISAEEYQERRKAILDAL